MHAVLLLALGLVAGALSGLFGVGGGIVFVPALTLGAGLSQHVAEATSLAAIVPVVALGALRQRQLGNVDLRAGILLGTLSLGGVLLGAEVAGALSDRALSRAFGLFLLMVAAQFAWRARSARGG
jgi:uncharacterized membrane protein YfcA